MIVIKNFIKDETGLELSEYVVAAGLITLAIIASITALGESMSAAISALTGKIRTS